MPAHLTIVHMPKVPRPKPQPVHPTVAKLLTALADQALMERRPNAIVVVDVFLSRLLAGETLFSSSVDAIGLLNQVAKPKRCTCGANHKED